MGEKEKRAWLPKDKKVLLKLGGLFLLGLLLLWLGGSFGRKEAEPVQEAAAELYPSSSADAAERRLEEIFSEIKGVGRVAVCLYYSSLGSREYAVNENSSVSRQTENAEGKTLVSEDSSQSTSYFTAGSGNQPVLLNEYAAIPESVLIVAEGAARAEICEQLFSVAQSLLGLPANKISVVPMK